jgi:tetratricopeptide (TPR) repeat protein
MNVNRAGDAIEGFGRLRFVRDGRIVWTTSTMRTLTPASQDSELQDLARRLAIRLAEPFGIIHADFRQATTSPATRCVFQALNVRRTMRADDHLAARDCIEELVERDPGFHPAWSQLALLILDEYTFGLNPRPAPLDRALSAAVTATPLAPSSARAQQVLMDVHFARGAIEDAVRAGREALARNPYDPDIMAGLGARYIQLNRPAEGLPLLERAIELSSGRPPWYDFFAFLGAHLMGADKLAQTHAAILLADESPLSLLGRALSYAVAGDEVGAMAAMRRLAEIEPLFPVDGRLYLTRAGFSTAVIDRILADLGPAAAPARP